MTRRVLLLCWALRGGGRGKALLGLIKHFNAVDYDVKVLHGSDGWSEERAIDHHCVSPDASWEMVEWRGDRAAGDIVEDRVEEFDPDVIFAWDMSLSGLLSRFDRPTISYLRLGWEKSRPYSDVHLTPSDDLADMHRESMTNYIENPDVRGIVPVWYLDPPDEVPPTENRPIDVMVHDRKLKDGFNYIRQKNTLLASSFSYDQLCHFYTQTKVFFLPDQGRFEPTPLMPIEAKAHGCRLAITENCGDAGYFPAYENPGAEIDRLIEETGVPDRTIPSSTDPIDVVEELCQ